MAAAAISDLSGSHATTHEASFVVRTSCKNFVMIAAMYFSSYKDLKFLSFRLESTIHALKIADFGGFYPQN